MSNEYKDWIADRKQDSITIKLERLEQYLNDLVHENDINYYTYLLLYDLVIELKEDVADKLELKEK